mgnify:FL=1
MAWVKFVREGIEIEVNAGMSVLEAEIRAGLRPDGLVAGWGNVGSVWLRLMVKLLRRVRFGLVKVRLV